MIECRLILGDILDKWCRISNLSYFKRGLRQKSYEEYRSCGEGNEYWWLREEKFLYEEKVTALDPSDNDLNARQSL
jgi:hypothetical protein